MVKLAVTDYKLTGLDTLKNSRGHEIWSSVHYVIWMNGADDPIITPLYAVRRIARPQPTTRRGRLRGAFEVKRDIKRPDSPSASDLRSLEYVLLAAKAVENGTPPLANWEPYLGAGPSAGELPALTPLLSL